MSYPAYPEYADTGLTWLGQVPANWELKRLGFFFDERREKVSDKDYPPLSVTKNGIVPQIETAAKTDDGDNRKKVCHGDFVINSRSDRKGSSGISTRDGSVSLINTVLRPREEVVPAYVHYLLRSVPFQEEFYRYGKGIVADLWSTNYSEMSNISLAMPSRQEQTTIANFLDRETAKIDALITEQEKLIELLAEKRRATISRAVTKGLNPDAPMKNSGVAWLGEIPENWVVKPLKYLLSIQNGADHKNIEETAGYPVYGSGGVFACASDYIYNGESVLLGRKGTVDRPLYVHEKFWSVDTMYWSIVNPEASGKFCYYVATTIPFGYYSTNTALPSMTKSALNEHLVACPEKKEQAAIAQFLDLEVEKFDVLKFEAEQGIALLKERRAALISAAVTGKIDVRNLVKKEAA